MRIRIHPRLRPWLPHMFVAAGIFAISFALNALFTRGMQRMVSAEGGPDPYFPWGMIQSLIMVCLTLSLPVALVMIFYKSTCRTAGFMLIALLFFMLGQAAASSAFGHWIEIRREAFTAAGARLQPVITAIEAYHADHAQYPASLEALQPAYLTERPSTGMARYAHYEFIPGAEKDYDRNPWVLRMPSSWGFGFDSMLYYPLQNYPDFGHGGTIARFGRWGYVYE